MNKSGISRTDLIIELDECRSMAAFLSEAVALILESASYTDKLPVPQGAGNCIKLLADKIHLLSQKVEGGVRENH